jgi:hypothetical protein
LFCEFFFFFFALSPRRRQQPPRPFFWPAVAPLPPHTHVDVPASIGSASSPSSSAAAAAAFLPPVAAAFFAARRPAPPAASPLGARALGRQARLQGGHAAVELGLAAARLGLVALQRAPHPSHNRRDALPRLQLGFGARDAVEQQLKGVVGEVAGHSGALDGEGAQGRAVCSGRPRPGAPGAAFFVVGDFFAVVNWLIPG